MIVDFVSDLHMEMNMRSRLIWPSTPGNVLVLAGDISCYKLFGIHRTDKTASDALKFLREIVQEAHNRHYENVFWVPGNHEYYGHYFKEADQDFETALKYHKIPIILANNKYTEYSDNSILIFSTFWTDYNRYDYAARTTAERSMNDYHVIRQNDDSYAGDLADSDLFNNKHIESFKFIKETVDANRDKRIGIFTHHAPSLLSHSNERFGNTNLKYAYCSEYGNWIADNPHIKCWIHGHTHHNVNYKINKTVVTSAMYGYDQYGENDRPFPVGQIHV